MEQAVEEYITKKSLKTKPKFEGSFLAIMKLEQSTTEWERNDVVESSQTRTMYRKVSSLAELAAFSNNMKARAREEAKQGVTTKFSIVTTFAQDEHGQVIGVEKYGAYGLQEWKVGVYENSDKEHNES